MSTERVIYQASGSISANARFCCIQCNWSTLLAPILDSDEEEPSYCPKCNGNIRIVSDDIVVVVDDGYSA